MRMWKTKPVHPGWVILTGLAWAGLIYANFYPNRTQKEESRIFAHSRIADAVSIRQVATGEFPDLLLDLTATSQEQELEGALDLFNDLHARSLIPAEASPSWGLLFHLLEDPKLAEKALNIDPGENKAVANQLEIVRALMSDTEASSETEEWLYDRYNDAVCSIPEYFYLSRIKDDLHVSNWLNNTSKKMIRRIVLANLIYFGFTLAALISLIGVLKNLRRAKGIPRCRIHQSWATSRLLFEFFAAGILSCCALLLLYPLYDHFYNGTYLLAVIASQVIPTAWLLFRLHPSPSIALKSFQLSGRKRATIHPVGPGLSGFGLLILGGVLITPLDKRKDFFTDSLSPHFLDYLPSISTGMFAAVILAPVFEEILFRGVLFGGLRYKIGALSSALLSSLIFAAMHGYSPMGSVSVAISGLIFCGLYRWTGSLVPGIIAHASLNLVLTTGTVAGYSLH